MKFAASVIFGFFFLQLANSASVDEIIEGREIEPEVQKSLKNLSKNEKYLLNKFRLKVNSQLADDYERTDEYLLGWLLSSKWNIFSAEQMLKRAKQWKRTNKIAELGKAEIPSDLLKLFPYTLDIIDKNGCPVLEYSGGKWNITRFMLEHEFPRDAVEKFKKYMWQFYEKAELRLRAHGGRCPSYILLCDTNGFELSSISDFYTISVSTGLMKTYLNVWPGALNIGYWINAPSNFNQALEIFRPLYNNFQVKKLNVFFGEEEWKPILLSKIDASELTPEYGGTKNL